MAARSPKARSRGSFGRGLGLKKGFVSFFSGALGLDLGLEGAGLKPLAANELDPIACETIRRNRPNLKLYDADIRELTARRMLRDLGMRRGELFLVVGGPPCQAFSTAGKRLGLNDERGNVFLHFIELLAGLRPKYFVIENVRGLLSAPLQHRPHEDRGPGFPALSPDEQPGGALRHIILALRSHGYAVSFNLYSSAFFGVPQARERLVIFGNRDGIPVPDLMPTHHDDPRFGLPKPLSFRDAVSGLATTGECARFPESRLRFFRLLKEGENWRHLPADVRPVAMGKAYYSGGGKVGFYRRLAWDKPAPTLVTSPTMPATDLAHPVEDRPLSIGEYARIQTFPDDWQFAGRLADKYRQIGNAVPVRFGTVIGRHVLAVDAGLRAVGQPIAPVSRYRMTDQASWERQFGSQPESLPLFTG